jgi:uncharacterized protein (DUF433 family)
MQINGITRNPMVMGGKPCLRGLRITVGTVLGMLAAGHSQEGLLALYPDLSPEDVTACLTYASFLAEEVEMDLAIA